MKTAVIGDGGWGTALAIVLNSNGHNVTVWGPFPDYISKISKTLENISFLPGVPLPPEIEWTSDISQAASGAELVILAVPTKYFKDAITPLSGIISTSCRMVSVAKGLDRKTHRRMSEVAQDVIGIDCVAALSGPSHAEEVARGIPTAVTVAANDPDLGLAVQDALSNKCFRVYTSDDVIGVELGGALKNVIAIAAGVSDGLGFGDNTKAALITRGLSEIIRLGCTVGAKAETFSGLSGMGDLIVTCTSKLSRNRAVGERIGKGEPVNVIMSNMEQAVEGVWNCASALELARETGVDVPITEQVHAIIYEGRNPLEAVGSLLARDPKPENL